ncbi:MAG: CaiB/BaiF CoA-transferase family protein [Chloroflexi bacterium]|nr:CaiB/BaiF CoA-transferase family protein [Chloroflexota bacterium]
MPGPLNGIVVIDLTHVLAGPFASMVLADLGAQVIKVEQPEIGDRSRASGPFIDGESSYFMSINRGKLGITLDLSKPRGKEIFLQMVAKADVVIENLVPGAMKRLGLDYPVLSEHNPGIIYAAISGFGQSGPYSNKAALDVIVQGMAGVLSITGEPGGPPIRPGVSQGDITAGLFSIIGILAALQERNRSGLGQMVDIAMLDCQVSILENAFTRYFATGDVPKPLGTRHPVTAPFQAFQTSDGYMTIALADGRKEKWPLLCSALDLIDLIDDPRFDDGWVRSQNWSIAEPILAEALRKKTTQEWLTELEALGIPCGPVNTIDKVAKDPQVLHRGMIKDIPHPRLGKVKMIDTPVKLSRTPGGAERPSPDLGEHTAQVLRDMLGLDEREIATLREEEVI